MNKELMLQIPKNEESPLQQYFDKFDIEHIDWNTNNYKLWALQVPIEDINKLLVSDWIWRKDHLQNVVASIEGVQGKGKSMPFSAMGLKLGQIFGVPFVPENIFFSPEEFDASFKNAKQCSTILKDEDPKTRVGMMSHMIDMNIIDYEEQSRLDQINLLQAGVELRKHAHFFCFEAKHVVYDENAYPQAFISILKTPRYTEKHEFVWRGLARFPMPPTEFVEKYLTRKKQNLKNLRNKYGSTLDPILFHADKVFKKHKNNLVQTKSNGTIVPFSKTTLYEMSYHLLGTRKFTKEGYKLLVGRLDRLLRKEFEEHNTSIIAGLQAKKELDNQKKEQQKEVDVEIMESRRKEKLEFMREKLVEEKKKNDLKERTLRLKEKALTELAQAIKKNKNTEGVESEIKKQLL